MTIEKGKYILKSDPQCMWIEEAYQSKTKGDKRSRRVTGYFTSFRPLLENFVQRRILDSDATSMEELLNHLAEIEKDLMGLADDLAAGVK